jgi:cytochrome c556
LLTSEIVSGRLTDLPAKVRKKGVVMRKLLVFAVAFLLTLAAQSPLPSQTSASKVDKLMKAKLQNSQKLLEGIAIGDFKKITASAEELIQLSKTAEWLLHKTPRYEMHSNEFQRAAETLIRQAKDKNMDGTTLAFFEMTMSCVRCHQHVREIRDARLPNMPLDDSRLTGADFKVLSRQR